MDRKSERKWRMRQIRLRTAIFFRRNGLHLSAFACLAVLGIAAAVLFSGVDKPTPVGRSDDERIAEVASASPKATVSPAPTAKPVNSIPPHASNIVPERTADAHKTSVPADSALPIPDMTPHPEATAEAQLDKLQPPVDGHVIRIFAMNSLIYSETLKQWMTHSGVDIAAKKGDAVYCVLDGTVDNVYTDDMLGVSVVVRHENGLISVYSNLKEEPPVKLGDSVKDRQIIGYIGDTAIGECADRSHLHFELHHGDGPIDPQSLIIFNKNND